MLLCMALLFRLMPLDRQGTTDFDFMRLRSPSTSDLPHPPLVRDSVPRHFLSLTVLGATLAALVCRRNRWPVRDLHQAGSGPARSYGFGLVAWVATVSTRFWYILKFLVLCFRLLFSVFPPEYGSTPERSEEGTCGLQKASQQQSCSCRCTDSDSEGSACTGANSDSSSDVSSDTDVHSDSVSTFGTAPHVVEVPVNPLLPRSNCNRSMWNGCLASIILSGLFGFISLWYGLTAWLLCLIVLNFHDLQRIVQFKFSVVCFLGRSVKLLVLMARKSKSAEQPCVMSFAFMFAATGKGGVYNGSAIVDWTTSNTKNAPIFGSRVEWRWGREELSRWISSSELPAELIVHHVINRSFQFHPYFKSLARQLDNSQLALPKQDAKEATTSTPKIEADRCPSWTYLKQFFDGKHKEGQPLVKFQRLIEFLYTQRQPHQGYEAFIDEWSRRLEVLRQDETFYNQLFQSEVVRAIFLFMALNFQGQTLTDVAKELPLDRLDQLTIAKIQDRILRVDTLPSLAARGRTPGGAMFSDEFYFYDESPHVEADGQHGYYETWDPWSLTDGWDGEEGYLTEGHWDHSVQHGCQMPI